MKTLLKYGYIIPVLAILLALAGCYDDGLDAPYPGEYPEGDTEINVRMDFEPFASNSVNTRGTAGDKMDNLDDLCVVAYDTEGNLLDGFPVEITKSDHGLNVVKVPRKDSDASNGVSAQSSTYQASFKMTVPYGRYYIYGVANLGHYTGDTRTTTTYQELTSGGRFAEAAKTRDGLLNCQTEWDENNYLNNCEMLGYFTNDLNEKSPSTGNDTNNKTVSIDRPGMTVHSWLRRCASKVTIDFDGSGLRGNIYVYIKRATIHDIPRHCALGMPNGIGSEAEMISYKNDQYRPDSDNKGVYIDYGTGSDYRNWPSISKGHPNLTDASDEPRDFHSETAEALYLYENRQGDQGDDFNKEQIPDKDGNIIGKDDMKDEVPYGSYIEVEAYYDMASSSEVSQGKIIYRFMLGKDALKNFDVDRNHHYKITMCVRGNGNDVDWHIEYEEKNGFKFRVPYYVSYLYNHESTLRFTYTPPEGVTVTSLDAEIIANNWWPEQGSYSTNEANKQNPLVSLNADPLDPASYRTDNKYPENAGALAGRTKYLGNGFLSLRATSLTVLNIENTTEINPNKDWHKRDENQYMNDNYFYGNGFKLKPGDANIDRSRRTYTFNENGSDKSDPSNTGREAYEVTKLSNGSLYFKLPVFTRAKNLVKRTGYTGNNPYESSERMAYVKITVHLSNGDTPTEIIPVKQVPRITNPKGIYRKSGNNENFHVLLTEQESDNGSTFTPFKSDGPWMAEVLSNDANFINLNGRSTIKGSTGSHIEFNVRFNKMNRDKKVRNAVIRVRYHNYSCVHLIFVRQGYDAQQLSSDGVKWHTTNRITATDEGDDPRDEGSLFRYGNTSLPIDVQSNAYPNIGIAPTIEGFTAAGVLNIATGKNTYTDKDKDNNNYYWNSITTNDNGFKDTDIARMSDFEKLYRSENIEHGFGVLYADGATETQLDTKDVYGYCRHDPSSERDKRGMCGVFAYYFDKSENDSNNTYNYRSIFFPVGRSGYGHRKHTDRYGRQTGDGVLRYSCGQTGEFKSAWVPNFIFWCPLFYDLYMRKGAIYWAREMAPAYEVTGEYQTEAVGLDMNFFTFDVNAIVKSNLYTQRAQQDNRNWDACFLRAIDE